MTCSVLFCLCLPFHCKKVIPCIPGREALIGSKVSGPPDKQHLLEGDHYCVLVCFEDNHVTCMSSTNYYVQSDSQRFI